VSAARIVFVVSYWLDDVRGTPGQCTTDYRVEKGETIYTKNGRAEVRSCVQVTEARSRIYLQGTSYRIA
jgi:hypothetical protein